MDTPKLITPFNQRAIKWLEDNLDQELRHTYGHSIAVEPRILPIVLYRMLSSGLIVNQDFSID